MNAAARSTSVGGGRREDEPPPSWEEEMGKFRARLDRLKKIATENAGRLSMPADDNYPIDKPRLAEWVAAQEIEGVRDVAAVIAKNVVHVSFREFHERLLEACTWAEDYVRLTMAQHPQIEIVPLILLPGSDAFGKSNAWTTMLALAAGKLGCARGLVYRPTEARDLCRLRGDAITKALVIAVDDASYSGRQMRQNISYRLKSGDTSSLEFLVTMSFFGSDAQAAITSGELGAGLWALPAHFTPRAITVSHRRSRRFC